MFQKLNAIQILDYVAILPIVWLYKGSSETLEYK